MSLKIGHGGHVSAPTEKKPASLSPSSQEADGGLGKRTSSGPVSQFRARLPTALGGKHASVAPVVLASQDLSQGLQGGPLQVPALPVEVTWQHPKALKHQGTQKEKLVLQTMQMAAHETINEARTKFKDAVQTLQQSVQQSAQKAPTDLGEMQATFEQACRNAATAITGEAQGAVVQAWQQHRARHKALDKLDKNFTLDMVKGGITIAASAGAAAAHAAALPLSIASIVKTVGMMGLQIKDYVADSDAAARDVISADKTLGRAATSDTRTALKIGARELAGAVGVPIDSVNGMEQQLEIFRAKSQRTERTAKRLHHAANQMMRKLEKLEVQAGSDPKKQQAVEQMRTQVSGLLDKVSTLMERVKSDETFYEVHKSRCKAYREGLGSKLKGTVRNIDSAQVVMDMAATAKSMAEVSRMVVGAFT